MDFETYYDDECSVKSLGINRYVRHKDFHAYLVACAGDDGFEFVGDPRDFDWHRLSGVGVVSHNAVFDRGIYDFGVLNGWWPQVWFRFWRCTANLCSSRRVPRSLKDAVRVVYGIDISKKVRSDMKGVVWGAVSESMRGKVVRYALEDARMCLCLWFDLN